MSLVSKIFLPLVLFFFCSCAFNSEMSLDQTSLKFGGKTANTIAVVSVDSRPYVVDESKSPEWIGLQRSGWGIPFGVHTESGKPLAHDFSNSIALSLKNNGIRAFVVEAPRLAKSRTEVLNFLKNNNKTDFQRVLLFDVAQWKSDTMIDVNLDYDLTLSILDPQLDTIVSEGLRNSEALDGSFWNPIGASERAVASAQKQIFENLLSRPSVISAIR